MNGHRCAICKDRGRYRSAPTPNAWVDCPVCKPKSKETGDIAHARASEPVHGGYPGEVPTPKPRRWWLGGERIKRIDGIDCYPEQPIEPTSAEQLSREFRERVGLTAPVRGRQVPPLGTDHVDRLIAAQEVEALANDELPYWNRDADPLAFTLTDDEPEYVIRRRHDDLDMLKVARWQGGALGWCIGVLMALGMLAIGGKLS